MLGDIYRAIDAEFQGYVALWGETDFVGWASAQRFWARPAWWAKAHPRCCTQHITGTASFQGGEQ